MKSFVLAFSAILLAAAAFGGAANDLYWIVDLAGGPTSKTYSVSTHAVLPRESVSNEYKTTKLVLRRVNPGSFMMGSPSNELGRCADEVLHKVTLTKGFCIGVYPVTQRQWELVMGDRPSHFRDPKLYATRPVETVSYEMVRGKGWGAAWPTRNTVDAKSFLGALRARTKIDFDLPTEAQWEYACRAGTTTALNSGRDLTSTNDCANMSAVGLYFLNGGDEEQRGGGVRPVGSFAPNAWGLYDMHGSVYEWCLDWWSDALADATDPKGPGKGSGRVCRGGCWFSKGARFCRSACRAYYPPSGGYYIGFRLACPAG